MSDINLELERIQSHIDEVRVQKRERLKRMDFFCLDNSIRESTVGQLRSHTLQNKIDIFNEAKKCGMKDIIVASFVRMTRVDDDFVKYLKSTGEDFSHLYSFSEVSDKGVIDGVYESATIPIGLKKNKKYGLINTFLEADLADDSCEWGTKYTVNDFCKLIQKRIDFVYNKISPQARILLNIRDFPIAMSKAPKRVLEIVKYLSRLPKGRGMFAINFEDPLGEYLPEELEAWTASVRRTMDSNGFPEGKILVHIHQKWDLQTASTLDCLSAGADGVWASICEEGAAVGHASSSVTMMNLVRMGNTKIHENYNCKYLRKAAIAITKITTGVMPHPKQVVYGECAVDLVFGFLGVGDFNMAEFFGEEAPNRITTLATVDMLKDRLTNLFGENLQFNDKICGKMKEEMLKDLRRGVNEEYHSGAGIALLFDRSGGKLTEEMQEILAVHNTRLPHHERLIEEVREQWDEWDIHEEGKDKGNGRLLFDSFYNGFMSPYFGCYRCGRTKKGLLAMDLNEDGFVDWKEFLVFIKWALRQYPLTNDADTLVSIVFDKCLIPSMTNKTENCKTAVN